MDKDFSFEPHLALFMKLQEAYPVFLCNVEKGEPKLGGPELEQHSNSNWFRPEWIKLEVAINLNIYPEEGKRLLVNLLKK